MSTLIGNSIIKLIYSCLLVIIIVDCDEQFVMKNDYNEIDVIKENYSQIAVRGSVSNRVMDCGGVYKNYQTEVFSPNYPENYSENLYCEYVFKSPYICRNQFHFQFLDFALEPSPKCSKDRLEIGESDVLCGSVIGIKTYDSENGVLKMKFKSDSWRNDKGFKLLVTRLPCLEATTEKSSYYPVYTSITVHDDDIDNVTAKDEEITTIKPLLVPPTINNRQDIPPEFNNPNYNGYLPPGSTTYPTYPTYPPNPTYPTYPPNPTYPTYPPNPTYPNAQPNNCHPICLFLHNCNTQYPSYPGNIYPQPPVQYPSFPNFPGNIYPNNEFQPNFPFNPNFPTFPNNPNQNPNNPGYPQTTNTIGSIPNKNVPETFEEIQTQRPQNQVAPPIIPAGAPQCCRNAFNQRRFYIGSQAFPSRFTYNQDCIFQIQRFSSYSCRLRIDFKFFLFGNDILNCADNFLEIDGQRICGCKSGLTYMSQWGLGPKIVRIRSNAAQYSRFQGFLLDIIQEDCPFRYQKQLPQKEAQNRISSEEPNKILMANSTSVTHTHYYYYYDTDKAEKMDTQSRIASPQQKKETEGTSSRFYYPNNNNLQSRGVCEFTAFDWLRLKFDPLWIYRPKCYPFY